MTKKEQSNCYNIVDCMGRSTEHYIYASNITEAKRKFKANTELWKKYGYYVYVICMILQTILMKTIK